MSGFSLLDSGRINKLAIMCEERSFDYEFETDTPILMEMQKNRYEKFKFVFFF
jgi:hypothetical protein